MKLGSKLNLISLAFIVVSALLIIYLSEQESVRNNIELEAYSNSKSLIEYRSIIQNKFDFQDYLADEWASMLSTSEYTSSTDGNSIYIPLAFMEEQVNEAYIFDINNELVYSFSNGQYASLSNSSEVLELFQEIGINTGVVTIYDSFYYYAAKPIISNTNGETTGNVLVLTKLDNGFLADIQSIIKQEIILGDTKLINHMEHFEPVIGVEDEFYNIDILLDMHEGDFSYGIIEVSLLNSNQSMILSIELNNYIQTLGEDQNYTRTYGTLLIMLSFGIIIFIAIRILIIRRIVLMNRQVGLLRNEATRNRRLPVKGSDEISSLSANFNALMDKIDSVNKELEWRAYHDDLTGTFNRRAGFEMIEKAIRRMEILSSYLCIAYVDIDGLKQINDSYGHEQGDQLLNDLVNLLNDIIGIHGHIIRIGGDEFIVLFEGLSEIDAKHLMDKAKEKAKDFNESNKRDYEIRFSYGVSIYNEGMTIDKFIDKTGRMMYSTKDRFIMEASDWEPFHKSVNYAGHEPHYDDVQMDIDRISIEAYEEIEDILNDETLSENIEEISEKDSFANIDQEQALLHEKRINDEYYEESINEKRENSVSEYNLDKWYQEVVNKRSDTEK